ncbi:unnamed protein product, partial [Urochloa humidicola]
SLFSSFPSLLISIQLCRCRRSGAGARADWTGAGRSLAGAREEPTRAGRSLAGARAALAAARRSGAAAWVSAGSDRRRSGFPGGAGAGLLARRRAHGRGSPQLRRQHGPPNGGAQGRASAPGGNCGASRLPRRPCSTVTVPCGVEMIDCSLAAARRRVVAYHHRGPVGTECMHACMFTDDAAAAGRESNQSQAQRQQWRTGVGEHFHKRVPSPVGSAAQHSSTLVATDSRRHRSHAPCTHTL